MHAEAGGRQIERRLDAGNAAAAHENGADQFFRIAVAVGGWRYGCLLFCGHTFPPVAATAAGRRSANNELALTLWAPMPNSLSDSPKASPRSCVT